MAIQHSEVTGKLRAAFVIVAILIIILVIADLRIQPPYEPPIGNSNKTAYEPMLELVQRQPNSTEQRLDELEQKLLTEINSGTGDEQSAVEVGRELIKKLMKEVGTDLKQDDPRLVNYVRKYMLTPPSKLPYNLDNNVGNPSQHGQNIIALAELNNKRNGFFIECGAKDGIDLSNSLLLERDYNWTGLLIEAEPELVDVLLKKHRKAWTSAACLSPVPTPKVLNFYLDRSRIHSLIYRSEAMWKEFGYRPDKSEAVPVLCIPLYTYMLALGISTVDYFSLDVEGSDFDVLQTIPFDKVKFLVLEVEWKILAVTKATLREFLEGHGYVLIKEIGADYMFVHSSLKNKSSDTSK